MLACDTRTPAKVDPGSLLPIEFSNTELTIVVPTRNERDNIGPLLEKLKSTLDGIAWEVVFVDDDSPDGTADLVRSLARHDPRVRCIHRIGRRGLTTACIEGILSSAAPFAAVMDADLQHDESLLPRMLAAAKTENLDVVIGSRYAEGGTVGAWDASRQQISSFATRLAQLLIGRALSDPMSGFFLIRRSAFDATVRRMSGHGFKILLDLFASTPQPFRYKELPYRFRERLSGESKLDTPAILEYLHLLLDKTVGRYLPVRFLLFALVGGTGVLVHMFFLALGLLFLPFVTAKILSTFIAMTSNFLINNLVTYRDVRLKGRRLIAGLLSFYAICSVGAFADVGVASILFFRQEASWWVAGIAGILIGSVWNYAMATAFTWRSGR